VVKNPVVKNPVVKNPVVKNPVRAGKRYSPRKRSGAR
jgi:hypothetical protein